MSACAAAPGGSHPGASPAAEAGTDLLGAAASESGAPLGIYLHIPFCAAICNYCNFNRGLFDPAVKDRYLAALESEIRLRGQGEAADTVFFGGGTPSLLESREVARLLRACRETFAIDPAAEITLEANPETVTAERLEGYRAAGVNRLSLGVQSFRDGELARLGRAHTAGRAAEAVGVARQAGFSNLSLDLMMWLPEQTPADWHESVRALVALAPDHASLYLLELYPNAPLRDEMARRRWSLAPDEDAAEMYLWALETLEAAGYEQYEISNVARPGRASRHNLKYWTGAAWVGLGCGAHSTWKGARWRNVAATDIYMECLNHQRDPAVERRALSRTERFQEALFTGLRLAEGVDLAALERRYDVDVWAAYGSALAPYIQARLLDRADGRLRLTRRGMLLANEVLAVFV